MALVRLSLNAGLFLSLFFVFAVYSAWAQETDEEDSGWSVCNTSSYLIQTAIAYSGQEGVRVQGWMRIYPGSCRIVLPGPIAPGLHYLYAQSVPAHRGGRREWQGAKPLCVEPEADFTLEASDNCPVRGLETRRFQGVLIEDTQSWTSTIRETKTYELDSPRESAEAAGVQRLLNDSDVFSGAIDGYLGKRTRAAIRSFLKEEALAADLSNQALMDALEKEALEKKREFGLTLCNRTRSHIWSALGLRTGNGWESRGWWQLEAGACVRVIDQPLLQTEYYIYAEMDVAEERTRKRVLSKAKTPFCIMRAKFAIRGREDCGSSAYQTAQFVETQIPDTRKLIFEFFDRDFGPVLND